ncbi:hypothetical protein M8J77_002510 [Diaphorina citri]|nr:hypothetical protein M8J77_010828 [Diaphorina citri]KAI5700448.1 hypothetical protein M8J77_006836 [Diaphorina citri]KAI5702287.1 hypothetical protein M8J77_019586 [Diaphorina citri]KAI5702295.1 hypothetical protein M8J77_024931 [Diaphorina citri]KAI5702374.1 hypothetical protein M8J77_002510 [Diaphorina citri]
MNASARTQFRVGPADPRRSLFPLVARPASPLSGGASVFARATAAVRAQSARPNRFSSPQWNVATRWEAVDAVRVELGADESPGGECSEWRRTSDSLAGVPAVVSNARGLDTLLLVWGVPSRRTVSFSRRCVLTRPLLAVFRAG